MPKKDWNETLSHIFYRNISCKVRKNIMPYPSLLCNLQLNQELIKYSDSLTFAKKLYKGKGENGCRLYHLQQNFMRLKITENVTFFHLKSEV